MCNVIYIITLSYFTTYENSHIYFLTVGCFFLITVTTLMVIHKSIHNVYILQTTKPEPTLEVDSGFFMLKMNYSSASSIKERTPSAIY